MDKTKLDLQEIMEILPHRYPFLMLDRVVSIERRNRLVAIKNVTINEASVAGYASWEQMLPSTMVIEAMAQAGGILLLLEVDDPKTKLLMFTGIEKAKFFRPVVPGDVLRVVAEPNAWRGSTVRMNGSAYVGEERVAETIVRCMVVDRVRVEAGTVEESSE